MDTFIDKLAQKFTAQEMIKANMAAEAKENKKLREQVETYEAIIQEMKQLNLKNMESAEHVNHLVQHVNNLTENGCESIKKVVEELQQDSQIDMKVIEDLFAKADDTMHNENVKVYRNVQAVINDGLRGQTETLLSQNENAKKERRFFKGMSIVILVAVIADIVLQVLRIFNII